MASAGLQEEAGDVFPQNTRYFLVIIYAIADILRGAEPHVASQMRLRSLLLAFLSPFTDCSPLLMGQKVPHSPSLTALHVRLACTHIRQKLIFSG